MNSKERVLTTISHEEPDRVPVDSWVAPEVADVFIKSFDLDMDSDPFALKKLLGDDLLYKHMGSSQCWSTIYRPEKK